MNIVTKFAVNNLVVSKYQRNPISRQKGSMLCCMEVIEIQSVTCMAGTQVFYDCRIIHGITETKWIDHKPEREYVDFAAGSSTRGEYIRFREDEIIAAPKEVIELVLSNQS